MEDPKVELEYYEKLNTMYGKEMAARTRRRMAGEEPMEPLYENTEAALEDKSGDRGYFVIVPHIIWHKARTKTDLNVWMAVKMIAGETGYCRLRIKHLAITAMCSERALRNSLKYWMKEQMLKGRMDTDPATNRDVWVLTVPDVWEQNVRWRKQNRELMDRIRAKAEQTDRMGLFTHKPRKPPRQPWRSQEAANAL